MMMTESWRWILLPLAIYALVLLFSARGVSRSTRSLLLAACAIVGSYVLLTTVASQVHQKPTKPIVATGQ